jgi:Bacterial conjugation TrbI-like protein
MRLPQFVHEVWNGMRHHPLLTLGVVGSVGLLSVWQFLPGPTPTVEKATRPVPYTGVIPEQASLESAMGNMQRKIHELQLTIQAQQATMHDLRKQQETREAERLTLLQQQTARVDAALQQAMTRAQLAQTPPATTSTLPLEPERAPPLRLVRPKNPPTPPPPPAAPPSGPWVQLPAGSPARGRLLNGVFATSVRGGGIPATFAIDSPFAGPQGTTVPLQGCRAIGKTTPNFSAARIEVELTRLACVLPDGRTFERPIKGYVTGPDNVHGIPGHVDYRESQVLANQALAAVPAGLSEAFRDVEHVQSVSPLGVTTSTTAGVGQYVARRIAELYLERAEALLPVVWVEPFHQVYLYLLEGVTIDGLTATAGMPQTQRAVFD